MRAKIRRELADGVKNDIDALDEVIETRREARIEKREAASCTCLETGMHRLESLIDAPDDDDKGGDNGEG